MAAKEAHTSTVEHGQTINYCRLFDALQCFLLRSQRLRQFSQLFPLSALVTTHSGSPLTFF
jgi:hypothetical protein